MAVSPHALDVGLSDAELADVGRIATNWAFVDVAAGAALAALYRLDDDAAAVFVRRLRIEQKIDLLTQVEVLSATPKGASHCIRELEYCLAHYMPHPLLYTGGLAIKGDKQGAIAETLRPQETTADELALAVEQSHYAAVMASRLLFEVHEGAQLSAYPNRPATSD